MKLWVDSKHLRVRSFILTFPLFITIDLHALSARIMGILGRLLQLLRSI
jgi:hypothetical protein